MRVTSSVSNKAHGEELKERIKGQKARGTVRVKSSGSENEEREMHGHEGEQGTENGEEESA